MATIVVIVVIVQIGVGVAVIVAIANVDSDGGSSEEGSSNDSLCTQDLQKTNVVTTVYYNYWSLNQY